MPQWLFGQPKPLPEQIISSMLRSGAYDGHADKLLSHLGDAAAVAVTKVLAGRSALTASGTESILTAIHLAFSAPHLIETQPDRQPRTSLFVLEYLRIHTSDPAVKARIEQERRFILDPGRTNR